MKQDVIFWIGVKSTDPLLLKKHGNFEYLEISKKCWKWWCKKNNITFFEYSNSSEIDTGKHKVTWTRWFDVFDQIEKAGIEYNKIALVDGSTLVKWDCPNFFNLVGDNLVAFRSLENLKWIKEGIDGYKDLFNNFNFDIKKYVSCGFQIFSKSHKKFLRDLKDFYYSNTQKILELQQSIGRGTDQPVYNNLLQIKNIRVDNIDPSFMLTHLTRFDWLSHNWQLKEDNTPFFIKYGNIWFYSGFDRTQRFPLMKQTWDLIKENYE